MSRELILDEESPWNSGEHVTVFVDRTPGFSDLSEDIISLQIYKGEVRRYASEHAPDTMKLTNLRFDANTFKKLLEELSAYIEKDF